MSLRGLFCWEELMTTDTAPAASFYGALVGLDVAPAPFDPNYQTWLTAKGPMGGLMALPDEARMV